MAKLTGPALSLTARGAIGSDIIMLRSRGQNIAKSWARPRQPHTLKQTAHRNAFRATRFTADRATNYWRGALESAAERAKTPYGNQFTQWNLAAFKALLSNSSMQLTHANPTSIPNPTITATALAGVVTVTLDDFGYAGAFGTNGFTIVAQKGYDPTANPPPPLLVSNHFVYPFTDTITITDPGAIYVVAAFWFKGNADRHVQTSHSAVTTVTV